MFSGEEIKKEHISRKSHLLSMVGGELVEKSISKNEFVEKYASTHTIFTKDNLNTFTDDLAKAIKSNPEKEEDLMKSAKEELSSLSQVLVKSEDGSISELYVKENKATEEEINKGVGTISDEDLIKGLSEEVEETEEDETEEEE